MKCKNCRKAVLPDDNYGTESEPLCPECAGNKEGAVSDDEMKAMCDAIEAENDRIKKEINTRENELNTGDDLVTVESYLSVSDAEYKRKLLLVSDIYSQIDRFGNWGKYTSYRTIDVQKKDLEKAVKIIREYNQSKEEKKEKEEKEKSATRQCPKCGSKAYSNAFMLSLLEQIRFAGCDVLQCDKCGKKWVPG